MIKSIWIATTVLMLGKTVICGRGDRRERRISGRLLRRISKAKAVLDLEPFLSWNFEANADTYLCVDCRMQLNKLVTAGLLYFVSIRDYIVRQYLRKDGNKTLFDNYSVLRQTFCRTEKNW